MRDAVDVMFDMMKIILVIIIGFILISGFLSFF